MFHVKIRTIVRCLLLVAAGICLCHIVRECYEKQTQRPLRDYAEIAAEGVLRVATEHNVIGFFASGDSLAGFHYEMLQAFARAHHLQTEITSVASAADRIDGIRSGRYDLLACDVPVKVTLADSLLYTLPLLRSRQSLVQRSRDCAGSATYISSPLELLSRKVHVSRGSQAVSRLRNMAREAADTIFVVELKGRSAEELIKMVEAGDIDYAVCEETVAQAVTDTIACLDCHVAIGFTQIYSWAVSVHAPELRDTINSWLQTFCEGKEYKKIYKRYFKQRK